MLLVRIAGDQTCRVTPSIARNPYPNLKYPNYPHNSSAKAYVIGPFSAADPLSMVSPHPNLGALGTADHLPSTLLWPIFSAGDHKYSHNDALKPQKLKGPALQVIQPANLEYVEVSSIVVEIKELTKSYLSLT